jgi:hypothetical protein
MYDYANLTGRVDFERLKEKLMGVISYRLITFPNASPISILPNLFPNNIIESEAVFSTQNTPKKTPQSMDNEMELGIAIAK